MELAVFTKKSLKTGVPSLYCPILMWGGVAPGTSTSLRNSDLDMIKVKSRGGESVEQMLRRFKKMCEKEGLTKDIKRNSYYEKPSERRRRRARKSAKRVLQDKR